MSTAGQTDIYGRINRDKLSERNKVEGEEKVLLTCRSFEDGLTG